MMLTSMLAPSSSLVSSRAAALPGGPRGSSKVPRRTAAARSRAIASAEKHAETVCHRHPLPSSSVPSSRWTASFSRSLASAGIVASMTLAPQPHAASAAALFDVSEDVFASTGIGPVLCVACTLFIGYVVNNGYATIKQLKEELTAEGYDVEEFNRVGELKAIRNAVDNGTVDSIFDKVWYQRAVMAAGSGSIVDVQKVQAYWKSKGIKVKTLADLDKVTEYMVKKYGKDGKMNM